jgi:P27 family predicted phage terminase small subunit
MANKPRLTVVGSATTGIAPPRKLGKHGQNLWNRVQSEYRIADAGGIELLAQACAALDRAEALAARINADGEVVHSRGGLPKVHPAVKDELACRAFVARMLERLGLNIEAVKPVGRPPVALGWTGGDDDAA